MEIRDYHVHTLLSACAKRTALPAEYIKAAKASGISTLGFTDHLWDNRIEGASQWYIPQTVEHSMKILDMLPEQDHVNVLIGCEADMDKENRIGLSEEGAANFDYVTVATTHFHMKGFTIEEEVTDPDNVRKYTLERMYKVLESDFVTAYAHPFLLFGFPNIELEVLSGISDDEYCRLFKAIAEKKRSLEINFKIFDRNHPKQENGFIYEYQRLFTLANEQGCTFHLGSDAHKVDDLRRYDLGMSFAKACGITEDRFIPLEDLA